MLISKRAVLSIALWLLALTTVWVPLAAQAQGSIRPEIRARSGYTPGQWAVLPAWCRDTQDSPEAWRLGVTWDRNPNARQWIAIMGSDFQHMHHYCRGLRYELMLNTIADLNPRERIALNERITEEMDYIINNCQRSMPLMPEAWLKKGDAHLRMDQLAVAQSAFEAARTIKPDYWPAYTRWADVLIGLKQSDRARALLERGLAHAPGQPQLLERLRLAGGRPTTKMATPAPAPTAAPAAAAPEPAAAPAPGPAPAAAASAP